MGIDCEIAIETNGVLPTIVCLPGFEIRPADSHAKDRCPTATHQIYTCCRFFGRHYDRGNWAMILYHLVQLMRRPEVVNVWYGGDMHEHWPEVTFEMLAELTALYLSKKETD